jgi:hypothetical protein
MRVKWHKFNYWDYIDTCRIYPEAKKEDFVEYHEGEVINIVGNSHPYLLVRENNRLVEVSVEKCEIIENNTKMNIVEVIQALKSGKKARRVCWNNNKFIYYVPAANYSTITDVAKSIMNNDGKVAYKEYIAEFVHDKVGFYHPTQDDILTNDWQILD